MRLQEALKKRRLKIPLTLLLLGVGGFMFFRWFEYSQVYHPDRQLTAKGTELNRPFENVYFEATDQTRLHGWFFPSEPNASRSRLVFLVCHGNAGNIGHRLDLCALLLEQGASVFLFGYRGYGESAGKPSEEGTYLDAQAAYHWLQQKGFRSDQIVAFGESLGGGIAAELALREKLGGLILQSTFTSIADLGSEIFPWLPVRWLNSIGYRTASKLPRIRVPVLVMHSKGDALVPFHHAENNFRVANEPKQFCELKGDHNEALHEGPNEFREGIGRFLDLCQATQALNPLPKP